MEEKSPVEIQVSTTEATNSNNRSRSIGLAGAFLAMLIIFLAGALYTVNKIKETKKDQEIPQKNVSFGIGTIVYGYWSNKNSIINALDLSIGKELTIATLGSDVKDIKILNDHELLYINSTDKFDYGKELVVHNFEKNTDKVVFKADENFGIDNYVVSPNSEYAAVWQIGNDPQKVQFAGSKSRVNALNLTSGERNMIYDETSASSSKVHYPVAISNTGSVYSDLFLPNSGAGWAYGMSVSNFSANSKSDIASMKNGTYSTQPIVSPDGNFLAFAGYSGNDGDEISNGFRKALIIPDTLEILNLTTMQRQKVTTGITGTFYSKLRWDQVSGKLFFETMKKQTSGISNISYAYHPNSQQIEKLPDISDLEIVSMPHQKQFIAGQKFQDTSGIGNLGSGYNLSYNKLYTMEVDALSPKALLIPQTPLQLITTLPSMYFPVVEKMGKQISDANRQLVLQTFEIKPTLVPQRTTEQNDPPPVPPSIPGSPPPVDLPRCREITYPQCNALLGTNYPTSKDLSEIPDPFFADCMWKKQAEAAGTCADSPLYLYGEAGTKINVRIGTSVSNSNVDFDENVIKTTLGDNGEIIVAGKRVKSISYDYISKVKKIVFPVDGFVASHNDVKKTVEHLAIQIGLNHQETKDVVEYAQKISSPYLFISLFDHKSSHDILPIYFDPVPSTYRNIVFYFEKLDSLPKIVPAKPIVIPIVRTNLTAIEISYIVR